MSQDRIVYSFVLGWFLLIAAMIFLDWLGNPNRGGFRPKGDRPFSDRETRRSDRTRRRLEEDAAVRAALRDAYGASSLRLRWSSEHEDSVRQIDDSLIVADDPEVVEVGSREVLAADHTIAEGDPLPNLLETPSDHSREPAEQENENEQEEEVEEPVEDEPPPRATGWNVGGDPLSLTAKGTEPAVATIRQRVWKNHADLGGWDDENLAAMKAGKPPRRTNPMTGRVERAIVDVETGLASWGSEPLDPFVDDDD